MELLFKRTTDRGATWVSQSSGMTERLVGVSFTDAETGTAVGYYGIILRTTTGEVTWVKGDPSAKSGIPNHSGLAQDYPNPFNPSTTNEVRELVSVAASRFMPLRTVGWDVAVAEDGPRLIEGNAWYDPPPVVQGVGIDAIKKALDRALEGSG